MPAQVDRLEYVLGMDDREFRTKAKAAEKQVGSMAMGIKRHLGTVAAAFGGTFAAIQLKSFVDQLGKTALSMTMTAARTEELDIVLRQVGKTSGYTYDYLKQQEEIIKSLGITTQASRTLLIRFMQSQLDVADAAKIARAAQDLAVIAMMDSSQAAETLTYAIAAQRPILLRQFGIVTDLSEVFQKYAKIIGKSAQDLNETEKRQAFLNVVMEQASRVAGTYEAAMTTAGKQMRSLNRYTQEAANAIGNFFLPMLSEMVTDVTKGFKEIRQAAEEGDVSRWQERAVFFYKTMRFQMDLMIQSVGKLTDALSVLKFTLLDFPVGILKNITKAMASLFGLEFKKSAKESIDMYSWALKKMEELYAMHIAALKKIRQTDVAAEATISDQRLGERERLLQLLLNYEKITLPQYVAILKQGFEQFKMTDEQKLRTREQILAALLEMEKTVIDTEKQMQQDYADFVHEQNEQMYQDAIEYMGAELDLERWKAERKRRIREAELAEVERQYGLLLTAYDSFHQTLYDLDMTGSERRKAVFESMYRYMVDQGMNAVREEIKNRLLVQKVTEGATQSELAVYTKAVATKIALMAKESWAAISAAAKWIYNAAAKIFAAHAGIPFAGVAIASGFVAAMMASLSKLKKFAEGGLVEGLDRGRDRIGALLTAGEYVMPKRAVQAIGVPTLDYMRQTGAAAQPVVVNVDMGGMSFNRMDRSDSFFIETSVIDRVTEAVKEAIRQGRLEI